MDSGLKITLFVIMPILLILASLYGAGYYIREMTMSSEYEYEVGIDPDEDIYNVSVKVPFPAELSEGNFSVPEGWEVEIQEGENMLRIEADDIYADSNSTLSLTMKSEDEIRTWDPFDEEPMLDPEADFNETACDSEAERCYSYEYTNIEVSYESDNATALDIYVELSGRNRWWLLENLEDRYCDRLSVHVEGDGEYDAEGLLKTGIGD
ncbi:MAG: hypothetical protein ACOC8Y_06235 [Candidatus Natronoplasma sp.]